MAGKEAASTEGSVESVSAATTNLAAEIAAEAQKEGWSADGEESSEGTDDDHEYSGDEDGDESESSDDEDEEAEEKPAKGKKPKTTGISETLAKAVADKDLDAIAEELGVEDAAKFFKIAPEDFKALRLGKRALKAAEAAAVVRVSGLETKLKEKYGDPVSARKAWDAGNYDAYFDTMEKWSGVPHADVQKAWHKHVQGKPAEDLQLKRRNRELEDEKAQRTAEEARRTQQAQEAEKVESAMEWIKTGIKGDKLAKYPGIDKMVFDVLKTQFNNGVKTPKKALEIVRADLAEKARVLRQAGIGKKKKEVSTVAVTRSSSKRSTSTNAEPGKSRKMTDAELAKDVLSGLGKDAWTS